MTVHEGITADDYHRDQIGRTPSLSSTVARKLLYESPAHAKAAHPRLTPQPVTKESDAFDLGTAVHALLLEDTVAVRVCDFKDWRTNAAKEAKEEARAEGLIPMLSHQWDACQEMVDAVRPQFDDIADPAPFTDGSPEVTVSWEDAGVLCRARFDWVYTSAPVIDNLKTTSRSAEPSRFARRLFSPDLGYDVQAAFYLRGARAALGGEHEYRWIVMETERPYEVSVVSLAPDALAIADAKVDLALARWKECLASGVWPGYDRRVHYAEAPPWEEAKLLEMRDEVAA